MKPKYYCFLKSISQWVKQKELRFGIISIERKVTLRESETSGNVIKSNSQL